MGVIVDSHCHLNILSEDEVGTTKNVVRQAKAHGVTRMLCISIDPARWHEVLQLAEDYPEVYAAIGIHPCTAGDISVTDEELIEAASHPKVIAIGEVGLDYHHQNPAETDLTYQETRLRQHIRVAKELKKPLVIHTRSSTLRLLKILREENAQEVGGIMHCFVEDLQTAQEAMELGFYISFSGILTFKNARELKKVAQQIPLDRILVETDSPYLAPVPYRGKTNQPAYTRYVVEELAALREMNFEEMAAITTENFNRLFKL